MAHGREQLRDWIDRRHFNQREASEYLSTPEAMVSSWLSGRRSPGLENAVNIERLTGIPVEAWMSSRSDESVSTPTPAARNLNLSKV
jgi:transcriptional regulator with XRE-family HTH domain